MLMTAEEAHKILCRISREACTLFGFSFDNSEFSSEVWRPDWLVYTVLPVPPPAVRPSVLHGSSGRSEDDLTYKLLDILKANQLLERSEKRGEPRHILEEYERLLQYHLATYLNNEIAGLPRATQKSGGRPVKSIRQRLKGKEGRVRGQLMGKRVDFSARSVITADPIINIDQVGVPREIAMTITIPERVNQYNIRRFFFFSLSRSYLFQFLSFYYTAKSILYIFEYVQEHFLLSRSSFDLLSFF